MSIKKVDYHTYVYERVMVQFNTYIININRLLKGVKSEISADYIYSNNKRIVIMTNR